MCICEVENDAADTVWCVQLCMMGTALLSVTWTLLSPPNCNTTHSLLDAFYLLRFTRIGNILTTSIV